MVPFEVRGEIDEDIRSVVISLIKAYEKYGKIVIDYLK